MPRKSHLTVVTEAAPPPAKPKTLSEAVDGGTYLEILVAQRRQMIDDLKEAKGPALAALHRQIALHSKEIAALQTTAQQEADEDAEVPDEDFDASAV